MISPFNTVSPPLADAHAAAVRMAALEAENQRLKQQLDWFKRQLFGRKSEKQLLLNPDQASLFARENPDTQSPKPPSKVIAEHRRRARRGGHEVNDTGLRFDETVPQTIIDIPAPELQGEQAARYEIIGYKESARLAQQRSIYQLLIYRRPVLRDKHDQTLITPPAPDNVLEECYADVSLLAGLMVDKAVYHLPLYRQHQRMLNSGIVLSRSTLLNYVSRGIALLEPIYQAQWQSVLDSAVLAMDEVPMKAGRKGLGKLLLAYVWRPG
nr:transposase [Kineobactrum salinum]